MTEPSSRSGCVLAASGALAQEPASRPGWTFIPSFGFSETYDDNVTLFGQTGGRQRRHNNDLISVYLRRPICHSSAAARG